MICQACYSLGYFFCELAVIQVVFCFIIRIEFFAILDF